MPGCRCRPLDGYHKLVKYPIRVTTQVYQLEGTLEWSGRFDFATVMVEGSGRLRPALQRHAHRHPVSRSCASKVPAILFNRRQVDLLAVITDEKQVLSIA